MKYSFIMLGIGSIGYSTVELVQLPSSFEAPEAVRYVSLGLAVLFFVLLVYSVFIEVGLKTYQKVAQHQLVTDGTYSLVRHPGVIWLFLTYLFMAMFFMSQELFITAFAWTIANTMYIIIQERVVLKKIFHEYDSYILTTPMIIPNMQSLRKFMTTTIWRKE